MHILELQTHPLRTMICNCMPSFAPWFTMFSYKIRQAKFSTRGGGGDGKGVGLGGSGPAAAQVEHDTCIKQAFAP